MGLFMKTPKQEPAEKISEKLKAPSPIMVGRKQPSIGMGKTNTVLVSSSDVTDYDKYLEQVLKDANQAGPDYFEFRNALKALDGQPMNEQQKYVVTYPTYAGMGVSSNDLVKSAEFYIKRLEAEKVQFDNAMQGSQKTGVQDKLDKIDELQEQIALLTKQIQDQTIKIQSLTEEANDNSAKLAAEGHSFGVFYEAKTKEINDQITKIKTYLNATV